MPMLSLLAQLPPPIIIFVGVKTPIGFFARLINVGLLKFRHAKKTARPTCFTALPPFCRKTKFVPCTNDSFRMGTHTFIIPLLSRFVNVTSGLFRAESEKIHFRGRKTHNLNIFGVFVRLHLRGRCDRIRENREKCFPANFRTE